MEPSESARIRRREWVIKGPHEIQNVADALDETAAKLDTMLERSRSVAADASHHLRTPPCRDAPAIGDDRGHSRQRQHRDTKAEAALVEVDRLTRRVDQVLAIATAETEAETIVVDVGESAHLRALDWQGLASDRGVDLLCDYVTAPIRAHW